MYNLLPLCRTLILVMALTSASPGMAADVTHVFIVAGQSNATGIASSAGLPSRLVDQADVLYWYNSDRGNSQRSFRTLKTLSSSFGPELNAGRILADAISDEVAIVKVSRSGAPLAAIRGQTDWSPLFPGGLYEDLIENTGLAMDALANDGKTARIAGMFWMQGETDGKSGTLFGGGQNPPQPETANAYEANLTEFIARVRSDLNVPTMPFFIGEINIGDDPSITTVPDSPFNTRFGEWDYTPTIQLAQRTVVENVPFTHLIETDQFSLGDDYLHFDQAGQLALGRAFAETYLAVVPEPSNLVLLIMGLGHGLHRLRPRAKRST